MQVSTLDSGKPRLSAKQASWRDADRLMLVAIGLQALVALVLGHQWGNPGPAWPGLGPGAWRCRCCWRPAAPSRWPVARH